MKKFIMVLVLFPLIFCGCKKEKVENDGYIRVKSLGETVKNPTNSQFCKPSTAEKTLSSVKHVSKGRFYYMDYLTDMGLQALLDGDYRSREAFEAAFSDMMFTPEGTESTGDSKGSACSGFVCHNEKGEVLLGRNFDGKQGPLMLLFNKANGYKFVQFTDPHYNSENLYPEDGVLNDGTTSLHRLMREPLSTMDGMNEYGLCFGAFQLPWFDPSYLPPIAQNTGKKAMGASLLHNLILSRCKTVKEVEEFMRSHDFVTTNMILNVHWLMADATGDWALFEYWDDELYVYREADLAEIGLLFGSTIPYERFSIENYYRHPVPYSLYPTEEDYDPNDWQVKLSSKIRVTHMMNFYKPVMSEREALECLQEGRFDLEVPNELTDWSCVYNPAQRTIIFALRNDMSEIYYLDLKKDL